MESTQLQLRLRLSEAVEQGQLDVVKNLLYEPFTWFQRNKLKFESTPEQFQYDMLCRAISLKNVDIFHLLMSRMRGNCKNLYNEERDSLLHKAVEEGSEELVESIAKSTDDMYLKNKEGYNPLHLAIIQGKLELVKILLIQESNVTSINAFGRTALHEAIKWGREDIAAHLIKKGAQVNQKSYHRDAENHWVTPMYEAIVSGNILLVELLLHNGADLNSTIGYDTDSDDLFLNDFDTGGNALTLAAANGHVSIVELLLNVGMDIDKRDYEGSAMEHALKNKHEDVFLCLSNWGGEITVKESGWTLLHSAAEHGFVNAAQRILQQQVTAVDAMDTIGKTPLMYAAENGHLELVKILLDFGASVMFFDFKGLSCLDHAAVNGQSEIVELLLLAFENCPASGEILENYIKPAMYNAKEKGFDGIVNMFLALEGNDQPFGDFERNLEIERLSRQTLLNLVWRSFNILTRSSSARLPRLPTNCIVLILSYLDDNDLSNLNVVCDLVKR